jgi:mersacidin/lichenicidin family type 2 lantibiotic
MKKESILRAWRDPEYRESLSAEERAALPAHPSAAIELRDEQLTTVRGGDVVAVGDISDTVKTSNTPGTQSSCCRCCAVAGDPATDVALFG